MSSDIHHRSIPWLGRIDNVYAGRATTPRSNCPYRLLPGIDKNVSSVSPLPDLKVDGVDSGHQVKCHGLSVSVLIAGACSEDCGYEKNARMLRIERDDQVGTARIVLRGCRSTYRLGITDRCRIIDRSTYRVICRLGCQADLFAA